MRPLIRSITVREAKHVCASSGVNALLLRIGATPGDVEGLAGMDLGRDLRAWWEGHDIAGKALVSMALAVGVPPRVVLDAIKPVIAAIPGFGEPLSDEALNLTSQAQHDEVCALTMVLAAAVPLYRATAAHGFKKAMIAGRMDACLHWVCAVDLTNCDCAEGHDNEVANAIIRALDTTMSAMSAKFASEASPGVDAPAARPTKEEYMPHMERAGGFMLETLRDALPYDLVFNEGNWSTQGGAA